MRQLGNRRAHLVIALAVVLASIARITARAFDVDSLAPRAVSACGVLAMALGAVIVAVVSRSPRVVTAKSVAACALAGAVVATITHALVLADRPNALLTIAGAPCGVSEAIALGALVGAATGGLISGFSALARRVARVAPELSCVVAWTLAAATSLLGALDAPVETAVLLACAFGAAIQIALWRRPARIAPIPLGPYR